ncbi:hypothetical protein D3C79_837010 [compost metagenome]
MNNAPPGWTITVTPTKLTSTATHWPRVTFSPSNGKDNAVTSKGARKLTAVASASGMYCKAVVNSKLVPSRHSARKACSPGRRVRNTRNPDCGRKIAIISRVCTR